MRKYISIYHALNRSASLNSESHILVLYCSCLYCYLFVRPVVATTERYVIFFIFHVFQHFAREIFISTLIFSNVAIDELHPSNSLSSYRLLLYGFKNIGLSVFGCLHGCSIMVAYTGLQKGRGDNALIPKHTRLTLYVCCA